MSRKDPLYVVTIHQRASGSWRWEVETSAKASNPLKHDLGDSWELPKGRLSGDKRTFEKAMRHAVNLVAEHVARDLRSELTDTFESNAPIAQASVS